MQSVLAGFVLLLYKLLNSLDIFPFSGNSTISRFLSANARTSDCSRCNSLAASRISSARLMFTAFMTVAPSKPIAGLRCLFVLVSPGPCWRAGSWT